MKCREVVRAVAKAVVATEAEIVAAADPVVDLAEAAVAVEAVSVVADLIATVSVATEVATEAETVVVTGVPVGDPLQEIEILIVEVNVIQMDSDQRVAAADAVKVVDPRTKIL